MSFLDDVRDAVVGVIEKLVAVAVDVVVALTNVFAQVGHDFASLSEYFRTGLEKALGSVLPDSVARLVTLTWYLLEIQVELGAGFVSNMANAIKTGNLIDFVNVVKPAMSTAMRIGRREALNGGTRPFPGSVVALMKDEAQRQVLAECRYTTLDRIDDKRFAEVWSFFSGHVAAICIIDVVVFRHEPDFRDPRVMFMVVHEAKHLLQFRDKGVEAFVSDYLDDKFANAGHPRLELEADRFACELVHGIQPLYLATCPV